MPANIQEMGNSTKVVANMDRSREFAGQQTFARMFSPQFMSDQYSASSNSDKGSLEITCGYDMDGHAQLSSVVLTNVPEPFAAKDVQNLKEGVPGGLSAARELGQRWAMEDRMVNRFSYLE